MTAEVAMTREEKQKLSPGEVDLPCGTAERFLLSALPKLVALIKGEIQKLEPACQPGLSGPALSKNQGQQKPIDLNSGN